MERKITEIAARAPMPTRIKTAAYARVSSGKDAMLHSLSAQVSHYSELIQSNPNWEYVGVYADEALTGTKENRANFQRMLTDCRGGKIDLIITKSISRFARNTVTLLESVRELKNLNVDVYFEEQNIHSISPDGELMLTILASYAQEESLSVSENQKWRIRKNFEEGIPWNGAAFGYRLKNGKYVIVPREAKIVKKIFDDYLSGMGKEAIANYLNDAEVPTRFGKEWCASAVRQILQNYSYTGNLILQKTYRENHITKKKKINNGELPKYHAVNTHEAIIPLETFNQVQAEIERRAADNHPSHEPTAYPFTGLIVCCGCGKHFRRKVTASGHVWICPTFNSRGKKHCAAKQIPDTILRNVTLETLSSAGFESTLEGLSSKVSAIYADQGNKLTFVFSDGERIVNHWADRSRAESWTDEMKQAARELRMKQLEDMANG